MKKTKKKVVKKNYATPGEPMTEAEFRTFISVAEEGPFLTEKEFKRKFEAWKKALEK